MSAVTAASRPRWAALVWLLGLSLGVVGTWLEVPGTVSGVEVVAFALAVAITERLQLHQPRGTPVPTSLAILGTAAILGVPPVLLAAIAAGGAVLALLPPGGPRLRWPQVIARAVGAWGLAGTAAIGQALAPAWFTGQAPPDLPVASLPLGAAAAVVLALLLGLAGMVASPPAPRRWRRSLALGDALRATLPVGASVAATAVLGALVHPVLGGWTLPTMLVALLAARVGLNRYELATRAYEQTVRAMSRLPEQLDTVANGHGVRVAELARSVGRELGLGADALDELQQAAHLHELGRIRFEPGAVISRASVATAGAQVLARAAPGERLADIVAAVGGASRAGVDPDVARAGRIIAACCLVDGCERYRGTTQLPDDVLVAMVRDGAEPALVQAVIRVAARR